MTVSDLTGLLANLTTPMAYLSALTGVLLLFGRDWRILLPIVLVQYGAVAVVLTESLSLPLAFSKLVVGVFVVLILYVTVRQLFAGGWMVAGETAESWLSWPMRLGVTVVLVIGCWWFAGQAAGEQSLGYLFAGHGLVGLGVWGFVTTVRPLHIGLGVLMILSGVELLILAGGESAIAAGFLAGAHLVTAVVVSYLAQTKPSESQKNVLSGENA